MPKSENADHALRYPASRARAYSDKEFYRLDRVDFEERMESAR